MFGPSLAEGGPWDVAPEVTLSEKLDTAETAVFVKVVSALPAGKDLFGRNRPARSTVEVVEVLRDPQRSFKVGQTLTRERSCHGATCLIVSAPKAEEDWVDLTPAALEYLKRAPAPGGAVTSRLKYFVSFVEDADFQIAHDVHLELSYAKFEDLVAIKAELPHDKLRQVVTGPKAVETTRREIYGKLLGLCGNDVDADLMEKIIVKKPGRNDGPRLGLDGVISGYLMLRKDAGLKVIETSKLADPKMDFSETFYCIQGVRFLSRYGQDLVPLDRLKASMRILLDRPAMADMAVVDLARWKDWSVMDRLMQMYGTPGYETPVFRRQVIRYLFAAQRDQPPNPKADAPEHVAKAKTFLEDLKRRDPKPYQQVINLP